MNPLGRMSIGARMFAGFGLALVLTLFVGIYGLSQLAQVTATGANVSRNTVTVLELMRAISQSQDRMERLRERAMKEYLLDQQGLANESHADIVSLWREALAETRTLLETLRGQSLEYERDTTSEERQAEWRALRDDIAEVESALERLGRAVETDFAALDAGDLAAITDRYGQLVDQRREFDRTLDDAAERVRALTALGAETSQRTYVRARLSISLALGLALVIGIVVGLAIQRSISQPILSFVRFAERVGEGDLTQRSSVTSRDELGRLGKALNEMVLGLGSLTTQTRSTTTELNGASSQILASTKQHAASFGEQSAAVQETTSTMEEVTRSGAEVAQRAKDVAASAEAAAESSRAGMVAMREMNQGMDAIREQANSVAENVVQLSEKTQAVGEIISAVDEIAERSNLLALNAAIEAASAGESGKSFSVVAQEMKNLAEQAKEATVQVRAILNEIQKGINTSVMLTEEAVKRVESGKQQTGVAESTITEMGASIEESVRAFQQIVAATNQQQIGFEQVARALQDINQANEQNSAGTQQLEQAASSLSTLGEQLEKAVQRYVL